ncbi:chitobiase/beta-hexosaminidase C-terminal domain-containing protein [Paenibacillus sp. NPDC056579]|uniref:chitobiase/beta-hexosaminidase C-terminal domain-containing protein n=1 Tax=Paenibacillus sp. NPDC056579 TaxID=3345871 RepID=UPI0036A2C52A
MNITVKQKSIFGIVIAIVCAAILAWSGAFFANADSSSWDEHADTSWYDPVFPSYSIHNAAQLAGVAKLVNEGTKDLYGFEGKIIAIENDLDLSAYSWVPIGTETYPFKGTLIAKNGATFTISGMKLTENRTYSGLIGFMNGGTVGGFIFDNGTIDIQASQTQTVLRSVYSVKTAVYSVYGGTASAKTASTLRAAASEVYVGAAVGKMTNHSTVYGITNNIPIQVRSTQSQTAVGGIVGEGEGDLSNSVNKGAVTVNGINVYAGGLVGHASLNGLKLKKLTNDGAILVKSSGNGDAYAAGVVGFASGNVVMDEESTPFENNGSVTAENGNINYAGGLIGKAAAQVRFSRNSSNNGAVAIQAPQADGSYAGGLIGAIGAEQDNKVFDIVFKSTKPVTNHGGKNVYTGGIAGLIDSGFTWIQGFDNQVAMEATGNKEVYTGGLIGKSSGTVTFNNGTIRNSGTINVSGGDEQYPDNAYTGGFVGFAGQRLLLEHTASNAYENNGAITVNGGIGVYTGGITANTAYAKESGVVTNVNSKGGITVSGQRMLYTGGFIGFIQKDSADKSVERAAFGSTITVTAESPDAMHTIRTGGIVGSIESQSASLNEVSFTGKLTATGGGDHTYTGGIAGYMNGGKINHAKAGDSADSFAAIGSDGSLGGVTGYVSGTVEAPEVRYISLTAKTPNGFAGGVAGKATGTITGARIGAGNAEDSLSMTIASTGDGLTAGGIVGLNMDALVIADSTVTRIGLLNETERSGYKLGAVMGEATSSAQIGEAGHPVEVKQVTTRVKAQNTMAGGAIGVNRSTSVYVQADQLELDIEGTNSITGGIIGLNDVEAVHFDAAITALAAVDLKVNASGDGAHIGGIYGENLNNAPKVLAQNVTITSSGEANWIGGIAGRHTGALRDSKVDTLSVQSSGANAEIGGIAGRSDTTDSEAAGALIVNPHVHKEGQLISASGENAKIGGIVGSAKNTSIKNPVFEAVSPEYVSIAVAGTNAMVGGIAGQMANGTIEGDAVMSNVANVIISTTAAAANATVGGIAGYEDATKLQRIVGSNVNLTVSGPTSIIGGIAGYNHGTEAAIIVDTYLEAANIKVNASAASSTVGGFVGVNKARASDPIPNPAAGVSTIQTSRVTGSVQVSSPSTITGGMAGINESLIANNSIVDKSPVISIGDEGTAGGLAGLNTATGTLYYTYSNASLTIEGQGTSAGGLVGKNQGQIIASYIDIPVTSQASGIEDSPVYLGGLVGRNSGTIEKSYTNAAVTAEGAYTRVGGLVGEHADGNIINSYAAKDVSASNEYSYAGGFLGAIKNGKVSTVYSAGRVTGTNGAYAGGFAGYYGNASKDLLYKAFYVKDEDAGINKDLPDFADGHHRFLNVHVRLSTILASTLQDRNIYPGLSGWDFTNTWKYGSLDADYKYPELIRSANTGGDGGNGGNDVNVNINWYTRDKDAIFFELKSEAELAGLAAIVNGTVTGVPKSTFEGRIIRLSSAIHIQSKQWIPIGNSEENAFQGTFEGNDYLIDGLTVVSNQPYAGLFGVIGQQGKVERVKLEPLAVTGSQWTGALAGSNQGTVSGLSLHLVNGAKISGQTVGGLFGKNTGTFAGTTVIMEGGSRIEGTNPQAIVGGVVGDNAYSILSGALSFQVRDGSIGSSSDHAVIGGVIGLQSGDINGLNVDYTGYRMSSNGIGTIMGGLAGHQTSGTVDQSSVVLATHTIEALGSGSVIGGIIGQSDTGNTIRNVTVKSVQQGPHLTGTGVIGGIVGVKAGTGTSTSTSTSTGSFDMDNVKVENIVLSSVDGSPDILLGGIAGKLTDAAVRQSLFSGTIQANADKVTAGGIVGLARQSIVYKAEAAPAIGAAIRAGESAIGGIAGIMEAADVHRALDFGLDIPLYLGIYNTKVNTDTFEVTGADNGADIYAGGIAGKLITASMYNAASTSAMQLHGAKTAAAGGLVGYSSGIIVGSTAANSIQADTSTLYHIGGVAGVTQGGEVHYSNAVSPAEQKIAVGSAVTVPDVTPGTHVGGFVGTADGTKIKHSFADVPVQIICDNQDNTIYAGGFAGLLGDSEVGEGLIEQAYSKGSLDVSGITGSFVGGFAGSVDHYSIVDAYAVGNISNAGFDTRSGGFAGAIERKGIVRHAYAVQDKIATMGINHATRSYTGGFAGYNDGTIDKSFAKTSDMAVNVSGANVYQGALVGYNFRDGKLTESSYMNSLPPVGRNIGGAVQAESKDTDVSNTFGFGTWNFAQDASFLADTVQAEVVITSSKQLISVVLLHNDLDFFQLFHRSATEKPVLDKLALGNDIDVSGVNWTPFAEFEGQFDGKGHKIIGLTLAAAQALDNDFGFITKNKGTVTRIEFENVSVTGGSHTGIVAGRSVNGAVISDIVLSGTVKGADYTGAVTGTNEGAIAKVQLKSVNVGGGSNTGGVAGINAGGATISDILVSGVVKGTDNVGAIAGTNEGTITKVQLQAASVEGGKYTGGVTGVNANGAAIGDIVFSGAVKGTENVGTIAGINNGTINKAQLQTVNVEGGKHSGGVTGINANGASIGNIVFSGAVKGTENVGAISGINEGTITKAQLKTENVEGGSHTGGVTGINANGASIGDIVFSGAVKGTDNVGAIAGTNEGTIVKTQLQAVNVEGGIRIGGVTGINANGATIGDIVFSGTVKGAENVGAIAGTNEGTIVKTQLQKVNVEGGKLTGGVTGINAGGATVKDMVLSGAVKGVENVGAIAGTNEGTITQAQLQSVNVEGGSHTGGVAGANMNGAAINDIVLSGTVKGADYAGAIAGTNEGAIAKAQLKSVNVEGGNRTGGVAGINAAGASISDIVLSGTVKGTENVGAIAGINDGTITKAQLQTVNIEGGKHTGGVAGFNAGGATIVDIVSSGVVKGTENVGAIAGTNEGTVTHAQLQSFNVEGGGYTGGVAGANAGEISGVTVKKAAVAFRTGESANQPETYYAGGIAGNNSGKINTASFEGTVTGSGGYAGGITGVNAGAIERSIAHAAILADHSGMKAAGGIAGDNSAAGTITQSFSYSDVSVHSEEATAGGIAGSNSGTISNSYNSGRIQAEGKDKAYAGGLIGHAIGGTLSFAMNYGEATASINGTIVPNAVYFGGIAGQKEEAAKVMQTAYDKQMLKTNTAYYDAAGSRVPGYAEATGLLTKQLASGSLPTALDASVWQAVPGFYPQLKPFQGSDETKLSTVAVILDDKDTVHRIRSGFELTKEASVVWSANPEQISILNGSGTLKTAGMAQITAAVQGQSRTITIQTPAPKYTESALTPKFVSLPSAFRGDTTVTMTTGEPLGEIYYTLDGSVPDMYSKLYTGPITLAHTTTLKAVTLVEGKESSETLTGVWTKKTGGGGGGGGGGFVVTEPTPGSGTGVGAAVGSAVVSGDGKTPVKLAKNSKLSLTAPEGQTIYYTTDGSTPTTNSPIWTGELIIKGSMTIKAITDKDNRVFTMICEVENAAFDWKKNTGQIKYIEGYEDGSFKPDKAISRYDLMYILDRLLSREEVNVGNPFADVRSGMEPLVSFFASAGVIDGYPDGTFGGEGELTRAEFVVMMSRVMKLQPAAAAGEASLTDVPGHWSAPYVNAFTQAGYVEGFPDGTFRPDSEISRAEAVVLINRVIGADKQSRPAAFADVTPDHWAFEDIMSVTR